jgi:hypothetical protein
MRTLIACSIVIICLLRLPIAAPLTAQGLDPATLLKPPADSWPTYHRDYTGQRHSTLKQITPANVHQLTLAWSFQTNQADQIKASPILHNGRDLRDRAQQPLGGGRAVGTPDLAGSRTRRIQASTSATVASRFTASRCI